MTISDEATASVKHADRFFIGGEWVARVTLELGGKSAAVIFDEVRVGDPFDPASPMGPLAAGQMRTGAIGHNGFKSDFDMGHGGFKQSGIGREGGIDGLLPFLESKAMLLDGPTSEYSDF